MGIVGAVGNLLGKMWNSPGAIIVRIGIVVVIIEIGRGIGWLGKEIGKGIGDIYHFAKKSNQTKSDRSTDAPSWAKEQYGEDGAKESTADKEAERLMREKYGDDWRTSGNSKERATRNGERSKIQKWLRRDKDMK